MRWARRSRKLLLVLGEIDPGKRLGGPCWLEWGAMCSEVAVDFVYHENPEGRCHSG
jgi:hypothetical protein